MTPGNIINTPYHALPTTHTPRGSPVASRPCLYSHTWPPVQYSLGFSRLRIHTYAQPSLQIDFQRSITKLKYRRGIPLPLTPLSPGIPQLSSPSRPSQDSRTYAQAIARDGADWWREVAYSPGAPVVSRENLSHQFTVSDQQGSCLAAMKWTGTCT